MSRATLARRYGPLLAVAAVQLLIIAVVPSTAPGASDNVSAQDFGGGGAGGGEEVAGSVDPVTGETVGGGGSGTSGSIVTSGGGTRTSGGGGGAGGDGGAGGGGGSGGGGGPVVSDFPTTGDMSHCVNGRQYDPALYEWAPPCVPKFTGNNGGSTYNRGVTKDSVKVMVMRGNYGPAVNAILERQGSPTPAQFSAMIEAEEKFLNSRYQFWGRKVDLKYYQIKAITGGQDKPEDDKLRVEMQQLVRDENPFAVIWANSVSSATYEELSSLKVVNLGGYGFTDDFNVRWRPYHWDVQMGGYQLAENVSTWYCTRMRGDGTAKAVYAGRPTTGSFTDLHTKTRKLGIISTNDPENQSTAKRFKALVKSKCGVDVNHEYYYDQNIQTLQDQRTKAYGNMTGGSSDNAATTVMCFCDQVAPSFLYKTCDDNNYFPEHVIVATGIMDLDRVAQEYDHSVEYTPPTPADEYPFFENAFGLAQFPKQEKFSDSTGYKVWKAGGNADEPYLGVSEDFHYAAMLGALVQMAGPKLTPTTLETGAQQRLGSAGNLTSERSGLRAFGPGDYTWNSSLREVYWAPKTRAQFNNEFGSYTSLNGGRWFVDSQFPSGMLALPAKPRP